MKALSLNQAFELQAIEKNFDDSLATNEALIKIHRIGICGTDYHAFRGKQPFFTYPRILGHELGAEVMALGAATKGLATGDKVAIEPYLNCGNCQACQAGKSNCCEELKVLGVHIDGGMCEYLKVPANKLHRSARLNFEQLALVETLSIGSHAVERAASTKNDLILVIGAGPIGLSVIQFAQFHEASICVLDTNQDRLDFVQANFAIQQTILAHDKLDAEELKRQLGGKLPTIIFDATGNPNSMTKAFSLIGFGSKIVFVGLFQGEITFADPNFHRREITLLASRNALPKDFEKIIRWMEEGKINTSTWISHRVAFEEVPKVFPDLLNPQSKVVKALICV